uniref:Family with sequence similarity 216 member A n=2 Tax=Piliocolobus tephrosceles TaxID=591936 RepID=A0A8C9HL36_9PRIM
TLGQLLPHTARGLGAAEMPGQGPGSDWTERSSSAEPPAVAGTEGGGGGSAGHSCYQNSKGSDRIKDGYKVNSHTAKLQELWKTPQNQTVHLPKSMMDASFFKHPDLTTGQKRYLCSIAKIYNANYLKMLMKRQYLHVLQHGSQKPGVLTHHRSRLSSRYSQKQHYPCTTWRHQLEREDSGPSDIAAASAPEMLIQHSLWRPGRNKEGIKTGYASKTRCKSLKIFRRPRKLFMQTVSSNDSESYMSEEKKEEDLLNKFMQSMSIEEQGEHLMLT